MEDGELVRAPKSFRAIHLHTNLDCKTVEDTKEVSDLMLTDVPRPGDNQFDTLQKIDDENRGLEKSNTQDQLFKTIQDGGAQSLEKPYLFFAYAGNYPERVKEALARRGNWQEVSLDLIKSYSLKMKLNLLRSVILFGDQLTLTRKGIRGQIRDLLKVQDPPYSTTTLRY